MSDDFYQSREWLDLRYRVLRKSNGCCQLCGNRGTDDAPLHCDHIKPRSKHPELELSESNIQVLCKNCNLGKSNKDATDWRWKASSHAVDSINRKAAILDSATPEQKGKLAQLGWLRQHDVSEATRKEAEKQYRALWAIVETDWLANGGGE